MSRRARTHPLRSSLLLLLGTLLLVAGCTEPDDMLVSDIGVTRVLLIDPDTAPQSVFDPEPPYQAVEWSLKAATLELNGRSFDLLFENDFDAAVEDEVDDEANGDGNGTIPSSAPCRFIDSVLSTPAVIGPCLSGLVIDSGDQSQQARLTVIVDSMRIHRARPIPLIAGRDFDGDGIPEGPDVCRGGNSVLCDDNCPALYNPNQADADGDGVGNACTVLDLGSGLSFVDSDIDGVIDGLDNCVWIENAPQFDTMGLSTQGVVDSIGDACEEQIADVEMFGRRSFRLEFDAREFVQGRNRISFLTVDFNGRQSLSCNWNVGRCTLDPAAVEFCVTSSAQGC